MARKFKNGDKARVVRRSPRGYVGYVPELDECVGKVFEVINAEGDEEDVRLATPGCSIDRLWFPESVLKLVPSSMAEFDLLAAMTGRPLKFRSGCDVKFIAYSPEAKPHCQLVLLNPSTGNIVTRYANGKGSTEPYDEPGDILVKEAA